MSRVFKNSKVGNVTRYGDAGPGPKGSVMTASFELEGPAVHGPERRTAVQVHRGHLVRRELRDAREVDELWEKLSEGGQTQQCGWLKDKFGLSWQIVPIALMELMSDPDPNRSRRVMEAMLQMTKIDIAKLRQAYEG